MTVVEKILDELNSISAEAQVEILDFVEYLKLKISRKHDVIAWNRFSLDAAMQGIESEPEIYCLKDLKE